MSAHIICVTGSGLPLMCRKKGHSESLNFATIGSLNGLYMFGKPSDVRLLDSSTNDYVLCWKEFEESIVIIGIASGCSLEILKSLLDIVFDVIVLIVGIDEIKQQRNTERLKRELKVCYPIVDRLLDSLDRGETGNKHATDILEFSEVMLCSENNLIKNILDSFAKSLDMMYSCVIISGRIAVATDSWWSLHPNEIRLLTLLALGENTTNCREVPIFLPYRSPNVAFRFVICTLMADVQLCCLCGSTPALNDIRHVSTQHFKDSVATLTAAIHSGPRNLFTSWNTEVNILSLLLINIPSKKYTIRYPQQNYKKATTSLYQLEIVRSFIYRAVRPYMLHSTDNSREYDDSSRSEDGNSTLEAYWCLEYHKCYATKFNTYVLCLLFSASPTVHAMRLITQKCFKTVMSEKLLC